MSWLVELGIPITKLQNWEPAPSPSWSAIKRISFSKTEKHPDFDLYISPGIHLKLLVTKSGIVTMHLAGIADKVCFTDQTGRYFPGRFFNITEF